MKKLIILMFVALMPIALGAEGIIKTVIITGQNNHNWKVSNVMISDILENTGKFEVNVAVSPDENGDMSKFRVDFSKYDLVVLDYNGKLWSSQMQKDFVDFVKNGGGVVVYHAANNSFPMWKEYNEICGLGGWQGRNEKSGPYLYYNEKGRLVRDNSPGIGGSHGPRKDYLLLRRSKNHPITKGLPKKWLQTNDELYDRMRGPANVEDVLYSAYSDPNNKGSGRHEPLILTLKYGRGKIFHTMLGHIDNTVESSVALQSDVFKITLARGAEWAATGKVRR